MNLVPVFTFIHIILYVLYLLLFLWLIFRWGFFSLDGVSKKQLAVFFLFKVVAGIILTLIYTYYYTDQSKADIYRYFNDSKVISALLFHNPAVWLQVITGVGIFEPEVFQHLFPTLYFSHPETDMATNNSLIIRIVSICNYFSYYNIYINTLFFNFASFVGISVLYNSLRNYFEEFPSLLFIPLYLLPSFVLWSSGMLKEQLVFTFLGPFLGVAICFKQEDKYKRWLILSLLLYVIYCIKPPVAACLFVAAFFLPVVGINGRKKLYLLVIGGVLVGLFLFTYGSSICEQVINKRNEFVALATTENAGSYFDDKTYPADCNHLFTVILKALLDSIFRPFVWEKGNVFQFLFALENSLFILLIAILLVKYFKRPAGYKCLIAFAFLVFAFLNYLIIGITVPITGAIIHYRIIATPFLLISILLFTNHSALKGAVGNRLKVFM